MENESMSHVWLKPCGCLSAAVVNKADMLTEVAKQQRYYSKHPDYRYELMKTEDVRNMPWTCQEHKRQG